MPIDLTTIVKLDIAWACRRLSTYILATVESSNFRVTELVPIIKTPRNGEIGNSDSEWFGGSNVGNDGGVLATDQESHGRPASFAITLPPLATVVFKPRRG